MGRVIVSRPGELKIGIEVGLDAPMLGSMRRPGCLLIRIRANGGASGDRDKRHRIAEAIPYRPIGDDRCRRASRLPSVLESPFRKLISRACLPTSVLATCCALLDFDPSATALVFESAALEHLSPNMDQVAR